MRFSTVILAAVALVAASTASAAPLDVEAGSELVTLHKRCAEQRACKAMCNGNQDCRDWCNDIPCPCHGRRC